MDISFRFYDTDFAKCVENGVREICTDISERFGGGFEMVWNMSTGPVINHPGTVERFKKAITAAGIETTEVKKRMSSEDFGWYLTKVPGMLFRFGTRNEALGCTKACHKNDFDLDEAGMRTAIRAFCSYILSFGK